MKDLTKRFAMLAVLGSLVCGILVAGCGGGDDDDSTTTNKATTTDDAQ